MESHHVHDLRFCLSANLRAVNASVHNNEKSGNPRSHAIRYTQGTIQNTIASDSEPKEKQKPQKMPKKGKEDVAEDVAEVTWFRGRSNVKPV